MRNVDVAAGMQAWRGRDWSQACRHLTPLLEIEGPAPDHLEALADSAWWIGEVDDTIAAREKAFAAYTTDHRHIDAARVAIQLAENHAHRMQSSVARGWILRAHRLLEGSPPTAELGHLRRFEAVLALGGEGGLDVALELAAQVETIGHEVGDRDLEILRLHDRGRFLVAKG